MDGVRDGRDYVEMYTPCEMEVSVEVCLSAKKDDF